MKLIKTESGIIAVSEEEILNYEWYYCPSNVDYNTILFNGIEAKGLKEKGNFKIVASNILDFKQGLKLKFSPEVASVLGVLDVEEESDVYSGLSVWINKNQPNQDQEFLEYVSKESHKAGFNRHAELSKKFEFTEQDMLKAMNYAGDLVWLHNKLISDKSFSCFIQSLRNKEFEVESFEKSEDTLTVLKLK